ncbi:MAG: adenylyl-sulfate kinase [Gammaproteobacteria bacterium]
MNDDSHATEHDSHASSNVVWHPSPVSQDTRARMKHQQPLVIWFTGLSASGKSTVAGAVEQILTQQGYHTYLLDGDNVRHGLCGDLGFSDDDRKENIRRVGEVAKLMADAGLIVLAAFISPFRADRLIVRNILPEARFAEVYVDAPIGTCKDRDPKGLYARAVRGEIKHFTGIDSPYEPPESPEVHLHTDSMSVVECVNALLSYLDDNGYLAKGYTPIVAAGD